MKIMISQPTFFPWVGYFDMIGQVDKFVILDDVKFSYQSWQNRNKFKTPNGLEWFTIPVISGKKTELIKNIKISKPDFVKKKFNKFILSNYNKSKYFDYHKESFNKILDSAFSDGSLIKLNLDLIRWILKILDIDVKIEFSSEMNIKSKKINKIIEICKFLNAKEYLTTAGSKNYLGGSGNYFKKENIQLIYHNYKHPKYNQINGPFLEYACVLDLIFNEGKNSFKIITSGRMN